MQTKTNVDSPDNQEANPKPYHTPELVVYGNIRDITRNVGPKGADDAGGGAAAGPKTG